MADQQSESTKDQGDKLEHVAKGSAGAHKAADPLEIPPPSEHHSEGSTKLHGDKLHIDEESK